MMILRSFSAPVALSEPCSGSEVPRRSRNSAQFHAQAHNHFNRERHLVAREIHKQRRSATLGEWRAVMA
jgi:hypothetical protein